ncbi:MAG: hypothetical protein M5U28_33975 [Sandaracinaceae bacterium]|nr:hypothetical protein [Sandaracinaceae bacterium]
MRSRFSKRPLVDAGELAAAGFAPAGSATGVTVGEAFAAAAGAAAFAAATGAAAAAATGAAGFSSRGEPAGSAASQGAIDLVIARRYTMRSAMRAGSGLISTSRAIDMGSARKRSTKTRSSGKKPNASRSTPISRRSLESPKPAQTCPTTSSREEPRSDAAMSGSTSTRPMRTPSPEPTRSIAS